MRKTVELTWIDVNDELPKVDHIVLGVTDDDIILVVILKENKYSGKKWFETLESGTKQMILFWAEEPETPNIRQRVKAYNKRYGSI